MGLQGGGGCVEGSHIEYNSWGVDIRELVKELATMPSNLSM